MIKAYLYHIRMALVAFLLFDAVFAAIFFLYNLELEAFLYASLLTLAISLMLIGLGFTLYRRKHLKLKTLIATDLSNLPPPDSLIEADYQTLLKAAHQAYRDVETQTGQMRGDIIDYYALWAHQIKTPIAAMRLLLKDEGDDIALSSELFKVEQYVEMALRYLHLESGLGDFVFKPCDMDTIIRQSARKFARTFIIKKIDLQFTQTHLTVVSDEKWLGFVLDQLFSNALKYTPRGHIKIYASGKCLIVEDTGIGIRPEDQPRIFEKGFTGYNGREDKKSTGIGLYLSKKILDALGHGISVASSPNEGAAFKIDLSRSRD